VSINVEQCRTISCDWSAKNRACTEFLRFSYDFFDVENIVRVVVRLWYNVVEVVRARTTVGRPLCLLNDYFRSYKKSLSVVRPFTSVVRPSDFVTQHFPTVPWAIYRSLRPEIPNIWGRTMDGARPIPPQRLLPLLNRRRELQQRDVILLAILIRRQRYYMKDREEGGGSSPGLTGGCSWTISYTHDRVYRI